MRQNITFTGSVRDATGRPVAGARVAVTVRTIAPPNPERGQPRPRATTMTSRTTTGESGTYSVTLVAHTPQGADQPFSEFSVAVLGARGEVLASTPFVLITRTTVTTDLRINTADLAVSSVRIVPGEGGVVTLEATVANLGPSSTPGTTATFTVRIGTAVTTLSRSVPGLGAGGTATVSAARSFTVPAGESLRVDVTVRVPPSVVDPDPLNNTLAVFQRATRVPRP